MEDTNYNFQVFFLNQKLGKQMNSIVTDENKFSEKLYNIYEYIFRSLLFNLY
jgi:hypothetical protein